jgi:hypothetical protein
MTTSKATVEATIHRLTKVMNSPAYSLKRRLTAAETLNKLAFGEQPRVKASKVNYLPKSVYSHLGNVPVNRPKKFKDKAKLGHFKYCPNRRIAVLKNMGPETALGVLGHEILHMILIDSGLSNLLHPDSEETLCDTFGTWLAGAVMNGKVVLK